MKYICPLCGKSYNDVQELSNCVTRDSKAIKEKENKVKETENQKAIYQKSLAIRRKEIEDEVAKLRNKISEYNTIGNKLIALDPKSDAHCTFSIAFTTNEAIEQFDKEINKQLEKAVNRFTNSSYGSELADIIDKIIF